jgi:hypothetical protein
MAERYEKLRHTVLSPQERVGPIDGLATFTRQGMAVWMRASAARHLPSPARPPVRGDACPLPRGFPDEVVRLVATMALSVGEAVRK